VAGPIASLKAARQKARASKTILLWNARYAHSFGCSPQSILFSLASPPTKLLNRFQRDFAMARPVGVGIESISLIATSPP
jgi:hypothetical protein